MTAPGYANHSERARRLAALLDVSVGPVLALAARATARPGRAAGSEAGERILLMRADHMGDLLMTTPAIRALRRARPGARMTLLASNGSVEAARRNPDLDDIVPMDAPWYEPHTGRESAPSQILTTVARLRRGRFDTAVEFRGDPRMILLAAATGAPRRAGFGNLGLGALLTDRVALDPSRSHPARAFDLVRALGAEVPAGEESVRPVFLISGEDRDKAAALLEGEGERTGAPLVVVAPATNRPGHTWGPERFAHAADRLTASGARVALTARAAEAGVTLAVRKALSRPALDLTGRTDLGTLAAILERADLLLANDSGSVHLAAAAGCPVVALFGPTSPALSFPYEALPGYVALAGPTRCRRPCFTPGCPDLHGWDELEVDRVVAACLERLGARARGAGART